MNQPVGTKQAELAGDPSREPSGLGLGHGAGSGIHEAAQVAVAEAGGGPFATADGLEEGEVGRVTDAEGADAPAAIVRGAADLVEEPMEGGAVVDSSEGL